MILFGISRNFKGFFLKNMMKTEFKFNVGLDEFLVPVTGINFLGEEKGIKFAFFAF